MFITRLLATTIIVLAIPDAPPAAAATDLLDGRPQPDARVITCTNPFSGATWQISIDYDRATVDANPARVSAAAISWHDGKAGGTYTLDRQSGELTVVAASSTGGYSLHDHCRLPP